MENLLGFWCIVMIYNNPNICIIALVVVIIEDIAIEPIYIIVNHKIKNGAFLTKLHIFSGFRNAPNVILYFSQMNRALDRSTRSIRCNGVVIGGIFGCFAIFFLTITPTMTAGVGSRAAVGIIRPRTTHAAPRNTMCGCYTINFSSKRINDTHTRISFLMIEIWLIALVQFCRITIIKQLPVCWDH